VADMDFKVIYAIENSNKFQKTRFWKEKSVEDVVTLGPTAEATLVSVNLRNLPRTFSTIGSFWKTKWK
jgi:hypothetical protein